jgi:hypothetical protein
MCPLRVYSARIDAAMPASTEASSGCTLRQWRVRPVIVPA